MWAILLGLALVACEPGVRFREIGPAEALRLLEDPEVVRVDVRPGDAGEELPGALPEGTERVLVVSPEQTAGRRVSARLARAGIPRVSLVVADPRALAQPPGG